VTGHSISQSNFLSHKQHVNRFLWYQYQPPKKTPISSGARYFIWLEMAIENEQEHIAYS